MGKRSARRFQNAGRGHEIDLDEAQPYFTDKIPRDGNEENRGRVTKYP